MSIEVQIQDESAFKAAVDAVRSDTNDINYVIAGHVGGSLNTMDIVATGSNVDELREKLDPNESLYCLARIEMTIDMSTTVKFVFIHWIGEKVPMVKKGKLGVMLGSIEKLFTPYHTSIDANTPDDVAQEKMLAMLKEASGVKSKVLESHVASSRQMRGFTQTQLPQRDNKAKFGVSAVSTKGANLDISQEVYDAVAKVRDDEDPTTWMLAGYQNHNPRAQLECIGSGSGNLDELKEALDDSGAMYGLYRFTHVVHDVNTVKFVYVMWVGPALKPMHKGLISTHKGTVEVIFTPSHQSIYASEKSELDEAKLT